jgi:thiol-disulfide isomerase/thioredoxin
MYAKPYTPRGPIRPNVFNGAAETRLNQRCYSRFEMRTHPVAVFIALSCGLLAACGSGGGGGISATTSYNVVRFEAADRRPAPALGGESLRPGPAVAAAPGVVTVVNFWGSWCGPCRREQPALQALSTEYQPRGARFGVNTRRDQRAAALAYLDEFKVTYPSIYDPASTLAYRFGVRFMPVTYVIDRSNKTAAIFIGALRDEADLRQILDAELAA